jgi:aminopeptidase N
MKIFLLLIGFIVSPYLMKAQTNDESWKSIYRKPGNITNELSHTKLDVKFDYDKQWLYGKEWVTLHPHSSSTDSIIA